MSSEKRTVEFVNVDTVPKVKLTVENQSCIMARFNGQEQCIGRFDEFGRLELYEINIHIAHDMGLTLRGDKRIVVYG